MNSCFSNRWSFSYLTFTKYVTNIIAEPKYKYGQQEQVRVRNHNRSTALERSVLKYWGVKPILRVPNLALGFCHGSKHTVVRSAWRFFIYQSLNRLPIWNSQNCSMFPLAFVAGWLQGHWWGFISRNYVVWPTFLLMNVFIALKGSHFWFLFDFTAAGVVPCGGRKTSPRTSTIVQFIFYFGPLRSAIIFWEIRNKWLV